MSSRLTLHPCDGDAAPAAQAVIAALRGCGLVDAGAAGGILAPGPAFHELVIFLGCSPVVNLSAGEERVIAVTGPEARARLARADAAPAPRCPGCRTPQPDWELRAQQPHPAWACAKCNQPLRPCGLDWRRRGGCARVFVDIHGVHADEAVPADALLTALAAVGNGPWTWFYR